MPLLQIIIIIFILISTGNDELEGHRQEQHYSFSVRSTILTPIINDQRHKKGVTNTIFILNGWWDVGGMFT